VVRIMCFIESHGARPEELDGEVPMALATD
jgi:hypothetical protein